VRAPDRGRLGEAAVSTADDVLGADDPGEPLEPLGDVEADVQLPGGHVGDGCRERALVGGARAASASGAGSLTSGSGRIRLPVCVVRNRVSLRCTVPFRPSRCGSRHRR
jgi:hypothetical protein